jgi:acyl carrier protein
MHNEQTNEKIKNEIKQIIARITRIDISEMKDHVLIREELGIDSLLAMEILATCEKHLGIQIDETLFAGVQDIGQFFSLLLKLYHEKKMTSE